MFDYLKTVNNLNEIFEWINVYPDGDVKVHIHYILTVSIYKHNIRPQ